ncbi:hypothetical protein [Nocardiopsis sp. NPDC055824]
MTAQIIEPETAVTARELRYRAVQILAQLLSKDLPEITWQVHSISKFLDLYTHWPREHEVLDGQADSHQDVRAWAAHLGTTVNLKNGDTPHGVTVINGIGIHVWCAPKNRDDLPQP